VYGRRGGRQYGATIARVAEQNIERFDEYEYYVNDNGVRSWVKGADGLAAINAHERESYVVDLPVSNFSVAYNNYLGGWIAMYYKPARGIVMRVAPTPYGPFGDETDVLLPSEKLPCGKIGLYGGFTHELMSANAGKTIYFIASQWNTEAYCSELFELCFE
jgi:carbohydrate-binding protein